MGQPAPFAELSAPAFQAGSVPRLEAADWLNIPFEAMPGLTPVSAQLRLDQLN